MLKIVALIPIEDRLIIKPDPPETVMKGIIIPDSAQQKKLTGTVAAVGPGKKDSEGKFIDVGVKAGDRIMYHQYSGLEFFVDGERFIQMKSVENLVCKIEEKEVTEGDNSDVRFDYDDEPVG